jgi:hypothetical protein
MQSSTSRLTWSSQRPGDQLRKCSRSETKSQKIPTKPPITSDPYQRMHPNRLDAFSRTVHNSVISKSRPGTFLATRSFRTTSRSHDAPIMNRYSRTVTQTKDQGASQVCSKSRFIVSFYLQPQDPDCRLCCTRPTGSKSMRTSTRPWSVSQVSGEYP